eukprot:CAMPEP_0114998924 /NCGR_PEP_ID=MMETSP0216-20121206/15820_1 /TAXON_ID=223996 /ORGANISM="Protocruzia adherens, Strain Boccale" /LENGTH=273 /DNA_ID=CAMNT_0002363661 /DNA_START=133 /DNA_END=954 /DNA_ORIENTATION=-
MCIYRPDVVNELVKKHGEYLVVEGLTSTDSETSKSKPSVVKPRTISISEVNVETTTSPSPVNLRKSRSSKRDHCLFKCRDSLDCSPSCSNTGLEGSFGADASNQTPQTSDKTFSPNEDRRQSFLKNQSLSRSLRETLDPRKLVAGNNRKLSPFRCSPSDQATVLIKSQTFDKSSGFISTKGSEDGRDFKRRLPKLVTTKSGGNISHTDSSVHESSPLNFGRSGSNASSANPQFSSSLGQTTLKKLRKRHPIRGPKRISIINHTQEIADPNNRM